MAVNLQYGDKWLIPLQDGYKVSVPHAGIMPGYAGGHPIGQLVRPAVVVDAQYILDDMAMVAWWWSLHESNRGGEFVAMLDTAGYLSQHTCRIVARPDFRAYNGNQATIPLQWSCYPSPPLAQSRQTENFIDRKTESGETRHTEGLTA